MQIRWSTSAVRDLERIVEFIRQDDQEAARQMAKRIFDAARSLSTLPHRGRPGLRPGSRELVLRPFILVYRVTGEIVEISNIEHGAKNR
jgi:addiction module RelE/StbE family toxin